MVLIEHIIMKNCRLCHANVGEHQFEADKKLIRDIYELTKVKVKDKFLKLLPNLICDECKQTIQSFSLFKQQIGRVDQCLKALLKSKEKCKSEDTFKCDQCSNEFINKEDFKKHLQSHESERLKLEEKQDLDLCDKKDKDYSDDDLNADDTEQETNTANKKTFICHYKDCMKTLSSAYTLKTHELKHQGKRSFLCVTCGKGFITKNSLTCHEKIHLEVKGYICKLCNIGFSVRSNLRAHEKKHHEGVRFYCSQCIKAFTSKSSLERHERIHTGVKDFKCEACPSAFYTRKELLKHQRYHQGLRSHKCDECFKTFYERHHLITHLRTHTGERPYVCKVPDCGKSFMESQKLKRHQNAVHAQT